MECSHEQEGLRQGKTLGRGEGRTAGSLYIVGTPIGNLEDMTYRGVRTLSEVGLIAAEDTRHTRKLLAHYDIHTKLTSYHEHNKQEKGPKLIAYLQSGGDLACVSDAGLPGIADPGSHLVQLAIAAGISVVPLPGANAALCALVCSGLDTAAFSFAGFLPRTGKKRREILEQLQNRRETLIFYEAPHHILETLRDIAAAFGPDRPAAIARELTKCHEEFRRGSLADLLAWCESEAPRGEFVLLTAGHGGMPELEQPNQPSASRNPAVLYEELLSTCGDRKEALRETAKQLGMGRREVYRAIHGGMTSKGETS